MHLARMNRYLGEELNRKVAQDAKM